LIVDLLANSQLYRGLSARIDRAFDYLCQADLSAVGPGEYEIDGRNIYARVQAYTTRLFGQGMWESHRHHVDLQLVVLGEECIAYAPLSRLTPISYDEAKDFLRLSGEGDLVTLRSGGFMLLWPGDGHMPCIAVNEPEPVKKIVIKIAID
jgi:biofilm protein TabA